MLLNLSVKTFVPQNCADKFLKVTQYMDELLQELYGLEHYNCQSIRFVRHAWCAPHSRTVHADYRRSVSRHYGHPYFHAQKTYCDGDIDSIILLLDGLVNFSRLFYQAIVEDLWMLTHSNYTYRPIGNR